MAAPWRFHAGPLRTGAQRGPAFTVRLERAAVTVPVVLLENPRAGVQPVGVRKAVVVEA